METSPKTPIHQRVRKIIPTRYFKQSGSVELDPSTDPKIDSKVQSESPNGNETSSSPGVEVEAASHTSHTLPEIKTAYRDALRISRFSEPSQWINCLFKQKPIM